MALDPFLFHLDRWPIYLGEEIMYQQANVLQYQAHEKSNKERLKIRSKLVSKTKDHQWALP